MRQGWAAIVVVVLGVALAGALPAATATAPASGGREGPVAVPEPSARALTYHRGNNVLWGVYQALGIAVPALFVATGISARLARGCRRLAGREFLAAGLFVASFVLISGLVEWPLDHHVGYTRAHAYGLSNQDLGRWVGNWAKGLGVSLVLWVACVPVLHLLLRRSPRRWWLWAGLLTLPLALGLAILQPLVLDPLFNDLKPLENRELAERIRREANRAGIGGATILQVDKSRDTKAVNAYVNGWLGTRRIVVWDTLLERLDEDEALAVVSHEMGHYVLDHVPRGIVVASALVLLGLYLVDRLGRAVIGRFGGQVGIGSISDLAALPLLLAIGRVLALVITPLGYAHGRAMEREADRFALELTGLSRPAATAFVDLQEANLSHPRPGWFYRVFRATHPSLAERIESCNSYGALDRRDPENRWVPRGSSDGTGVRPGSGASAGALDATDSTH